MVFFKEDTQMISPCALLVALFLNSVYGQLNMKISPKGNSDSTIHITSGSSSNRPTINSEAQKRSENDYLAAIARGEATAQRVREEQRQRLIEEQNEQNRIANAATATSKIDYYRKRYDGGDLHKGMFSFDNRCQWGYMPDEFEGFSPERLSALKQAVQEFLGNRHIKLKNQHDNYIHNFNENQKYTEYDGEEAYARYALNDFTKEILREAQRLNSQEDFASAAKLYDIAEFILDTITTFTPGISTIRDLYEAVFGRDLITSKYLNANRRVLAAAMVLIPMKATHIGPWLGKFEKLIKRHESFHELRKLLDHRPLSELKETIAYIKKYKFYGENSDEMAVSIVNAFRGGARVKILEQDMKVYRYYRGDTPRGPWITDKLVDNPHERLALLHNDPVKVKEYIIPKGTEVLQGEASLQHTQYGVRWGGATQFLVDKKVLKDVP